MRDAGRVVGGIIVACAVAAVPVWFVAARGAKTVALPKALAGDQCIESREDMRKHHPALLAAWRERVVRNGDRVHDKADGRQVRISLTGTCLGCHGNAAQFCDKCHARAAVTVSCWGCHPPAANRR
jgi:hypothetical protein